MELPEINTLRADSFQFPNKESKFKKFIRNGAFFLRTYFKKLAQFNKGSNLGYRVAISVDVLLIALIIVNGIMPAQRLITPLFNQNLSPLTQSKGGYEVFGFAPYWTFDKLSNVDFKTLTTFAYFGVDVDGQGNLDRDGAGYKTFISKEATEVFKKAHFSGTRVVLTLTQMNNASIRQLMDNPEAQDKVISQTVAEVKNRGIDGVNIDFEYMGNPGDEYRNKFTRFMSNLTDKMHQEIPSSRVSVSVYASAIKEPKIYDISALGSKVDTVFMMAYDFAVAGSDNAIPTSPLYGHKSGKYWYDVSTAVDDFLTQMPANKLVLGVPYYGYNYLVYEPEIKAETRPWYSWRGRPTAQTYSIAKDYVKPDMEGVSGFKEGWDQEGQVGWKAYYVEESGTWRMVFLDDPKSLGIKYDFAKSKNLGGVGIWALGFDEGKSELWALLKDKFGNKDFADNSVVLRQINEPQ